MIRVRELIQMLEGFASKHGEDAPIGVYSYWQATRSTGYGDKQVQVCRDKVYIDVGNISTVLTSKGKEVDW